MGNNRRLNDYDGNKKVKGVKRHIVTDKNGFLLAVMVIVAHVHDSKAVLVLMHTPREMLYGLKVIIADGIHRGANAVQVKKQFGYILQVVMRSDYKKQNLNQHIKDG